MSLGHLRQSLGRLTYRSGLYNWSLGGAPEYALTFKPVDPWPGDLDKGRALTRGVFEHYGEQLHAKGLFWEAGDAHWMDYLHKFEWMRDLRALGGDEARFACRAYIDQWLKYYFYWNEDAWSPDRTGRRLAMWLSLYDFYGESADEEFQDRLLDSILRQARHLYRIMPVSQHGLPALESLTGLVYSGLAIPDGERWLDYALQSLAEETSHQILSDGGHISRNPETLLRVVMLLSDVRRAILSSGYALPEKIQHALDRTAPALRFFRMSDKSFCLFNGAQEGDSSLLDKVILQADNKGRIPRSLYQSGYERISQGRTQMIIDTGRLPPSPDDLHAHVSPGAFELIVGRERVMVSCGSHPTNPQWQDMLRNTAAHNTLTVDHRNAIEIKKNGHIGRRPKKVESFREDLSDGSCLFTVTHDGYVPVNGLVHTRRLFVNDRGDDIRGEDTLTTKTGTLARPAGISIRFHLHPRVMVSLIREGEEALLRLPNGHGWRFYHEGTKLELENSIYLGTGIYPRKTKQLVLSAEMQDPTYVIQWALQKEG